MTMVEQLTRLLRDAVDMGMVVVLVAVLAGLETLILEILEALLLMINQEILGILIILPLQDILRFLLQLP